MPVNRSIKRGVFSVLVLQSAGQGARRLRDVAVVGGDLGGAVLGRTEVGRNWPADRVIARLAAQTSASWTNGYLRQTVAGDFICGLAGGLLAFQVRFSNVRYEAGPYLALSLLLPLLWVVSVRLAGGYDSRFIGVGTDEFRRVLNAGICLTACVAILSYATKTELARGYVVIALPSLTVLNLFARLTLRKRLHKLRALGSCMRKVVVVGHLDVVTDLAAVLRRESYHGLSVVAACVAGVAGHDEIGSVPVIGGLGNVADTVERYDADTVAVLSCPEMSGATLRDLAWELEKTGTDLCVAPALLDVAGPRTTIRPVAGLPLLHMDHPEFTGIRRVVKSAFDRTTAGVALLFLLPLFLVIIGLIRLTDPGPGLFRQVRVGRGGRVFTVYKFRTMVVDAEERKSHLAGLNESDGVLFKIRRDPRVTRVGGWLRRWSLDELPQLINVLIGDMSMVGPRPALPQEAALYGDHVRRRLAVKPGMTGLWQVNGRSDLSWDESVRLDLRYVENWSFMLDLQILWKTTSAVLHGSGAY
jgi:exopolysaccharide biosynthesis polyprenyl glycosylphosphotransferase